MPIIKCQVAYIANRGRQPSIPKEKGKCGGHISKRSSYLFPAFYYAPIDKRSKSLPFHGRVRGSNPLGSTIKDRL